MCECPAAKMTVLQFALLVLTIIVPLNGLTLIHSDPPKPNEVAKMARYIIHNSDWVSIATVSTIPAVKSYPFVNVKSMSDGPITNGTGMPYFYMSPMDLTAIDVTKDNRITILASLAESDYCKREDLDPQDPRCARVIITGHFIKVDPNTEADEYNFAKNALFSRHPSMKHWPTDHSWYIAKVDMELIIVLDFFGGVKYVSIEDYFNANVKMNVEDFLFGDVSIVDVMA